MNRIRNRGLKISSLHEGFTLIELLIVVAIIGILATLLMVNFIGIRQRARDAQRKSDLRQIQSALELYRSDQGSYPVILYTTNCPVSSPLTGGTPPSTYMQKVPCDSLGTTYYNNGNYFYQSSGGTSYTLVACLENTSDQQGISAAQVNTGVPTAGCSWFYQVTNP